MKIFDKFLTAFGKTPRAIPFEVQVVTLNNGEKKYPLILLQAADYPELLQNFILEIENSNEYFAMFQHVKIINSLLLTIVYKNKKIIIDFSLSDVTAHNALFGIYASGKIGIQEINSQTRCFLDLERILKESEYDWINKIKPIIFRETFKIASQTNEELKNLSTEQIDSLRHKMPEMYLETLGSIESIWLKK